MTDLPDSPYTRNYFMSSMRHGTGNAANRGLCQQFDNPLNSAPVQRALFLALDAWTYGKLPPSSRVPRLSDGTLVLPVDTGFPTNIPDSFGETSNGKVTYTGLKTSRYRFNLGPGFYDTGIPTIFPPVITPPLEPLLADKPVPDSSSANGPIYPSFVPKTDRDGNDIAGVRLPDVTVPLATYTGWALRRGPQANDGCEAAGQYIPFAKTKVERLASGDPRPSVEERYPSFGQYYSEVIRAVDGLVKDRLMLCEDAEDAQARLLDAGLAAGVSSPHGNLPPQSQVPQCHKDKN
jgi:Alpha/beta hydrolase domain